MASRQAVPAVEIRIPRRIPVGNKIGTQTRFIPCQGTAYNLLHPAVVEVNAWSESGHAATLPRHTPAGQEGIPAACENPSPTYFKQKRRIHPLSIKSSYPVRLMKNKSAKSHILSYCAGSALLALAAFSAGQAAAGVHAGEVLAHSRRRQNIHPVPTPRAFPSGALQRADAPFTLFSRRKAPLPHHGIHSGCLVPAWNPRPHYRGHSWPVDVRREYFPPAPRRHARPLPPPGPRYRSRSPRPRPIVHPSRFHRLR